MRDRAGQDDFKAKGVDCDAAIRQLHLLRYVNLGELELHSNAIKYLVLLNERDPLKSGGGGGGNDDCPSFCVVTFFWCRRKHDVIAR